MIKHACIFFNLLSLPFFGHVKLPPPLAISTYDTCSSLGLTTDKGINVPADYYFINWPSDTAVITSVDSMLVSLNLQSRCDVFLWHIQIDGVEVKFSQSYEKRHQAKLLSFPGRYEVVASAETQTPHIIYFTILLKTVGLSDLSKFHDAIKIYPNPLTEILHVESESLPITNIEIFDSSHKKIWDQEFSSTSIVIFSPKLPPGLYFIQIALLNKRVAIRKLTIL